MSDICQVVFLLLLGFVVLTAMPKKSFSNNRRNNGKGNKDKESTVEQSGDGETGLVPPIPTDDILRLPEADIQKIKEICRKKNCKDIKKGKKEKNNKKRKETKELISKKERKLKKKSKEEGDAIAERIAQLTFEIKQLTLDQMGLDSQEITPNDDGILYGDIILTLDQASKKAVKLRRKKEKREKSRKGRSIFPIEFFPTVLWTMPIEVVIPDDFSSAEKALIRDALSTFSKAVGCIRFKEVQTPPSMYFILFEKINITGLCGAASIGKVKKNIIYVNFGCTRVKGRILHELMHTMGVVHQHTRLDRNKHVKIMWDNIDSSNYAQFAMSDFNQYTSYGLSYDKDSVMHYGGFAGAVIKSLPSILSLDGKSISGQRTEMKQSDINLLKRSYCCKASCKDKNLYCGYYANVNYCIDNRYEQWLSINCQKSCSHCSCE